MASPLFIEKLSLPSTVDVDLKQVVAIDAGYHLTKVLCNLKEDDKSDDIVLTCATFKSAQSQEALQWLIKNSNLREGSKVSITGQVADNIKLHVQEITKQEPLIIDEIVAQSKGIQFLIQHKESEELFYKEDQKILPQPKFGKFMERIIKARDEAIKQYGAPKFEGKFPFVYADCGAKMTLMMVNNESDKASVKMFSSLCALDFFGLGQLLLNTMNYNEIMEMAKIGDRVNVDCVAKDVFSISEDSPYATNPDMPLMHFGRPADHNFSHLTLENIKREDLANSLVHAITATIYGYVMAAMRFMPRIYVGGNVYKHTYMRESFRQAGEKYGMGPIPVTFLKYGLVGALGSAVVMETN